MKNINTKTNTKIATAILLSLGISACNVQVNVDGETVADFNVTKTGVVSNKDGKLTVNGTTINAENAKVVVDGVETDSASLKEGMVVSVIGTESPDGTANATQIIYNDDVEGIVLDNSVTTGYNGTLNVLGQAVKADANTVFESYDVSDLSISDIDKGNIVEVSGYSSGNGEILATRIEVKNTQYNVGEEIELKGIVTGLTGSTFKIGELNINLETASLDADFMGTLQNGQYVEVSSYEGFDNNGNLIASEIDLKSEGSKEISHSENDGRVEIKGAITKGLNVNKLEINGYSVLVADNLSLNSGFINALSKGIIVEAEGYINIDGQFVATKLEIENESDSNSEKGGDSDSGSEKDTNETESSEENEDHDD